MSGSLERTCEEVRGGAGLFALDHLGVLRVAGDDRIGWLNGMVTNDVVRGLAPEGRLEAAIVDVRGKLRALVDLWQWAEEVLVVTERDRVAVLIEELQKLVVMEDVTLEDASAEWAVLSVQGPNAADVVAMARRKGHEVDRTGSGGLDLMVQRGEIASTTEALVRAGAVVAGPEVLEALRVEAGIPRWGADVTEDMFPQEARIEDRRVSFQKGCYVGQEVVVRLQLRGHANRLLCQVDLADADPPAPGAVVRRDDREVGRITSSARIPVPRRTMALALLRRDVSQPGSMLDVEGRKATVVAGPRT